MLTDSSPVFSCLRRPKWILSSKSLIKPLKSRIANSTLPSFTRFLNPIDSPMFHLAMGWNFSAHVSFCNGLEWLRPCFISQWAGMAPPMLHSLCLVIRGWDASWFNLSTRLGHQPMSFLGSLIYWILQPIWLGWILIGCVIDRHREGESAWQGEGWGCWLQPCVFMFLMAEEEELDRSSTSIKCLNPNPWCKHLKQAPWRVPPSQGIQTKVIPSPLLSVRGCEWGPTPQSSFTIH